MKGPARRSLAALCVVVLLAGLGNACSANAAAYKTVGSLVTAVDLGMNAWGEHVRAERAKNPVNPVLDAQEAKVRKAFSEYQAAIRAAQGALDASTWTGQAPTADLVAAGTALLNLVNSFRGK